MVRANNRRYNVLVLTSTFPRWPGDSTPPFVYELAAHLDQKFTILVLAPHFQGAKFKEKMGRLVVYRFPYFFPFQLQQLCYEGGIWTNLKNSWFLFLQIPFLFLAEFIFASLIILKQKPKLIHAHWTVPQGLVAVILKKIFLVPLLITSHGTDAFLENKNLKKINSFVVKQADFITANSQATRYRLLKGKQSKKCEIIPMGVNCKQFKPLPQAILSRFKNKLGLGNKKIILFVGRITNNKGIFKLVNAMPSILKKNKKAHLLVIGSGQINKLKRAIRQLGLEKNITTLGQMKHSQLVYYYNIADVMVLPSLKIEGLGVVILEAFACQTPVVASQIGGIPEIITDKKTGLLIKKVDNKALTETLSKILNQKSFSQKLAANAFQKLKLNYDWPVVAKRFDNLYQKLLL